ncbi:hypothetical protein BaRGS_00019757 [Batillaria attramentaria]|uniref:Testicular haploid expressed gene protein-like n=1 Tax=Batillaria attramentaria TaxID=370345 RepID=A0ABD0KPU6_9CAEN
MAEVQTTKSDDYLGQRLNELAQPRRFAHGFERDRRSVYWVEREPPKPGPNGVTVIVATPRVQQLAEPVDAPKRGWTSHRLTPIWRVSQSAQQATASERISYLAQHRDPHPHHKIDRTPYMVVSPEARTASASARLETLAQPKERKDHFEVYQSEWGQYFHVPPPALKARATERLEYLSEPKKYHKDFHGEKPIQWPVSEQAMKSLATLRLQQLSRPRSRTMIRDDYDPYKVTPAARKARPTPRLEELSAPIPRKCRQKKT